MKSLHIFRLLAALLMLTGSVARADVLVLVHGWSANADTWLHSGVLQVLEANGWSNAGIVTTTPDGVSYLPAYGQVSSNKVYRVQLPAEAPLMLQAAHLTAELRFILQRHPNETITLAGHSAGGVVARLVLIQPNAPQVNALVTIASPNLGTSRAIQGLDIAHGKPFFCPGPGIDFLKSVVGGDDYDYLQYSTPVLVDLVPSTPGSLIGWLNQQPHPDINYHAVIRQGPGYDGDELVPAFSQDLNRVAPIRGRAKLYLTPASHTLNPGDGRLLAQILAHSPGGI